LRVALTNIVLRASSRDVIAAILEHGEKEDVIRVLRKIAEATEPAYYENQIEMCIALMRHFEGLAAGMPETYLRLFEARDFWTYISAKERRIAESGTVLPIRLYENRVLFVRILAHAIIGLSRSSDEELLRRLINHKFITISRPAAGRLSELLGEGALQVLAAETDQAIPSDRGRGLAESMRFVERILFAKQGSGAGNRPA
jgi:hypothetical protein